MEGAKAHEGGALGAQIDIGADDIDDVVSFFDPLFQGCPIFGHGAPADEPRLRSRGIGVAAVMDRRETNITGNRCIPGIGV